MGSDLRRSRQGLHTLTQSYMAPNGMMQCTVGVRDGSKALFAARRVNGCLFPNTGLVGHRLARMGRAKGRHDDPTKLAPAAGRSIAWCAGSRAQARDDEAANQGGLGQTVFDQRRFFILPAASSKRSQV
jgi:hypothetical protein